MDIMKAILDIENKAQEIENSIESLGADIKKDTDKKILEYTQKAQFEIDIEIEKFREEIKKSENGELESTKAEMKEALAALEEKYRNNREKWIKEITEKVIEGDKDEQPDD